MFSYLERRHWFFICLLIFVNVAVFGCIILLVAGKISF